MRYLPSLRQWLLSTSILSVIAGYALLLGVNARFGASQRTQSHHRLVAALRDQPASMRDSLDALASLGIEVQWLSDGSQQSPVLDLDPDGRGWLTSVTSVRGANGLQQRLLVKQEISAELASEREFQLLLIAMAGLSVLLTALLFRVVLWRGLVRPLDDLSAELDSLSADSLGERLVPIEAQPLELQRIAGAFNRLQQRLAAAWQRERRFVDGVSHELRTPITLIYGYAQRLLSQPHPSALNYPIAQIQAEASRMSDLITVLLELARCDAGRLAQDLVALDPDDIVLQAFERLSVVAPQRLQLEVPAVLPLPQIFVDAERLQQCFAALVDNALRYSSGLVQLYASQEFTESSVIVVLHVADSGSGIPANERAQVIQRFERGSTALGQRGSGIGLAMVHDLILAMDAELSIADREGGGADLQMRFKVDPCPVVP